MVHPTNIKENNLSSYFRWLDNRMGSTLSLIEQAGNDGITLENIFKEELQTDELIAYENELNLVKDIISYSIAYSNDFNDFERVTEVGGDLGKLKPNQTIGTKEQDVIVLEGKDPFFVINNLVKDYKKKNPGQNSSPSYRIALSLMSLLSRYIQSVNSFAGGDNDEVEILAPWYLEPNAKMELKNDSGNYQFDRNNEEFFVSKSNFFTKSTTGRFMPGVGNLNFDKQIETANLGRYIFPNPPQIFEEVSIANIPSGISLENTGSNAFLGFIPYDDINEFRNIYSSNEIVSEVEESETESIVTPPSWNSEAFNTDGVKGKPPTGFVDLDRAEYVRRLASDRFNEPLDNITSIVSAGTIEYNSGLRDSYTASGNRLFGLRPNEAGLADTAFSGAGSGYQPVSNNEILRLVRGSGIYYGGDALIDIDLKVVSNSLTYYSRYLPVSRKYEDGWRGSFTVEYRVPFLSGMQVQISTRFTSIDGTKTESLFSKDRWNKYMSDRVFTKLGVNDVAVLPLYSDLDEIQEVTEIEITSQWLDEITILVGNRVFTLPSYNKDKETIARQKIIFT